MFDLLEGQYLSKFSAFTDELVYPNLLEHVRFTGPGATDASKAAAEKLAEMMFKHGAQNGTLHFLPLDQLEEHAGGNGIGKGLNADYFDPVKMLTLAEDLGMNGVALHYGWAQTHRAMQLSVPLIWKASGTTMFQTNATGRPQSTLHATNPQDLADTAKALRASAIGFTYYFGSNAGPFMDRDYVTVRKAAELAGLPLIVWAYPRGPEMDKVGTDSFPAILGAVTSAASRGGEIFKINFPGPQTDAQWDYTKAAYGGKLQGAMELGAGFFRKGDVLGALKVIVNIAAKNGRGVIFSGGAKADPIQVVDRVFLAMAAGALGVINGRNVSTTMGDVVGAEALNPMDQVEVIEQSRGVIHNFNRQIPEDLGAYLKGDRERTAI